MWVLVPEAGCCQSDERFPLLVDQEYNVGRKEPCQIVFANDVSISRKHALLTVTHPENQVSHPEKPPVLTITDLSKFGTFVNDKNLNKGQVPVRNGDLVKFGTSGLSQYRAVYEPFIVTTSCLEAGSKKTTKQTIKRLGGHVVSDWRKECHTVVMGNLSVTIKVICALVSQKAIVTPAYLEDLLKAIMAKTKRPDPLDYQPPLAESQIDPREVSFKPNRNRKTLFQGKLFIFLTSKQFKKLSLAIELGGGVPMLMEEGTDDNVNEDIIVQSGSCVMNFDPGLDQSQSLSKHALEWIDRVMKLLKKHGRRPIPESEIGFAVLYYSTETYCNPEKEPTASGAPGPGALPAQSLSQMEAPGGDTERETRPSVSHPVVKNEQPKKVKNEPISQSTADRQPSNKRAREEEQDQQTRKAPRMQQEPEVPAKPEPRTPRTTRTTKQEVVTPVGSGRHATTRKQEEAPPGASGMNTTSESRRSKRRREDSDSDSVRIEEQPEPEVVDLDSDEDAFGSVPTRGRSRGTKDTTQRAKHSRHTTDSASVKLSPVRPVEEEIAVSPKRPQRQSRQPDSELKTENEEFDLVPSRGQRNKARSQVKNEAGSKVKTRDDSGDDLLEAVNNNNKDVVKSHDAADNRGFRGDSGDSEDGLNIRAGQTHRSWESTQTSNRGRRNTPKSGSLSSSGGLWLSSKSGDQAPVERITVKEDDMPVGLVVTETTSLVVSRQQKRNYEVCQWEGQNVKNFKRFKKGGVVTFGLREIIGGTDLAPYISDRKASDDWLKDQKQAEKEREEYEKIADDFFDMTEREDNRRGPGKGQRSTRTVNGGRRR